MINNHLKLPPLPANGKILAFGDSLTAGWSFPAATSYPALLAKYSGLEVISSGIPGEMTEQGLYRLSGDLTAHKPDLLILCHGANDILQGVPPKIILANLTAMVELAHSANCAVLLVAVPRFNPDTEPAKFYRQIADSYNIPLEERALTTIVSNSTMVIDIVHPNPLGYQYLAQALLARLVECGLLEKDTAQD